MQLNQNSLIYATLVHGDVDYQFRSVLPGLKGKGILTSYLRFTCMKLGA